MKMKFTHWLANLISGGALSAAHASIWAMSQTTSKALGDITEARADLWVAHQSAREEMARADQLTAALRTIAAMPTPKANATVRRMAVVAREALE